MAVKKARKYAQDSAWSRIRELIQSLRSTPNLAGIPMRWSGTDPTGESFIRQHLIRHSLVFLDAPPDLPVEPDAHPSFDNLSIEQRKPVAGILNLTEWYNIYAADYIETVFRDAVRNRRDEIYLTDNNSSVIILANYWLDGDTLAFYQQDLVLATQFELSWLTHLRFLAFYLRSAPETVNALALNNADSREALSFVLDVQNAVLNSSHDHPAEPLVVHGFTRRFLGQIADQRGTTDSLEELDSYISRIARAIELRTGLDLSEKNFGVASKILSATLFVLIFTILALVATVVIAIVQ